VQCASNASPPGRLHKQNAWNDRRRPSPPIRTARSDLAWHIARRPGGLVALAIQYGHMRTVVSAGYASRSRDGIHDLLDIETARATVDTLATLNADLIEGVGISGPAARRAINAAAHAPEFIGTVMSTGAAKDIRDNPQLCVYDNPGAT
jgi:hypothetical protein